MGHRNYYQYYFYGRVDAWQISKSDFRRGSGYLFFNWIGVRVGSCYMGGKKLKEIWKRVEYLPVTILDNKERALALYYILSPVDPIDCLDVKASNVKPSPVDKDYVHNIDSIVLFALGRQHKTTNKVYFT
nr:hypothetical protein [Niastella vici]